MERGNFDRFALKMLGIAYSWATTTVNFVINRDVPISQSQTTYGVDIAIILEKNWV